MTRSWSGSERPGIFQKSKGHDTKKSVYEAMESGAEVISIKNPLVGTRVAARMALAEILRDLSLLATMGSLFCATGSQEAYRWLGKPLAIGSLTLNAAYLAWHCSTPCRGYGIDYYPGCLLKDLLCGPPETREEQVTLSVRDSQWPPLFNTVAALGCAAVAYWGQISALGHTVLEKWDLGTVEKQPDSQLTTEAETRAQHEAHHVFT